MPYEDPRNWMWSEACAMLERAERMQRQFFRLGRSDAPAPVWEPPVDLFETQAEVVIVAALPGVSLPEMKVLVDGDEVVIAGQRRLPDLNDGGVIHRLEIPYGRFERRIRLASERYQVTQSELADGCLTLRLSKPR